MYWKMVHQDNFRLKQRFSLDLTKTIEMNVMTILSDFNKCVLLKKSFPSILKE